MMERHMRQIWIASGRPRGMTFETCKNYKHAKSDFRRVQQAAADEYIRNTYDDINKATECDIRFFWKHVKRKKTISKYTVS